MQNEPIHMRVRMAVEDSGLKHRFIAQQLGVSPPVLSAMLSGQRKILADEFFLLCEAMKMRPDELYNYQSKKGA